MNRGFRFLCQAETRRLLTMLGITVAFVLGVQYVELPYTKVIASVLTSAGKISSFAMGSSNSVHDEIAISPEPSKLYLGRTSTFDSDRGSINATAPASGPGPQKAREPEHAVVYKNFSTSDDTSPVSSVKEQDVDLALQGGSPSSIPPTTMVSLPNRTSVDSGKDLVSPMMFVTSNATSMEPDTENTARKDEKSASLQGSNSEPNNNKPMTSKKSKKPPSRVVPISEMNKLLQQSHASSQLIKPRRSSVVDQEITHAKSEIKNAPIIESDSRLYSPLYRNVSMFKRSYELMEDMLNVYIYPDGEKPIFHEYLLDGIYSSEGWFMKLLEANKQFVTKDPGKAHLFYIPFSSRLLQLTLYVRNSHRRSNLIEYMKNHIDMIARKYPFWNRTDGEDHFVVACHDWAPAETRGRLLNSIRALCNADIDVGFKIGKDVSLPETYVVSAKNPLRNIGGNSPSERPILAFFAGGLHGYLRPILLKQWENKEPDMKISGPLPHVRGNANYLQLMKSSKYCICARGHEVNSPRVVEAFFHECVPVIISDNFIPPFFEVLNWESFAVFVMEKDIPNLRDILLSISEERYLEMHKRVKMAQQHFLWHAEPVKYDLFHMILHSIWYNRIFRIRST